jgi:hypothetical protein
MAINGQLARSPLPLPSLAYKARARVLARPFSPRPSFPASPSLALAPRAEVKCSAASRCPSAVGPELTLLFLLLHSQDHQDPTATPRSTQPRPQPSPRWAPVIPTAPHRRTTSTPPHRRHRAAGELRTVPLLLPVQSVSQTVPRSLEPPSPVMPRRAPPPAPPGAAAHCLARLLPFLLHPIKAHQDLLSTPRPSLPHLPHHSAAAAERRGHRPSPPLGHRLRCFPLPSDPWISFPISSSSSPCLCL